MEEDIEKLKMENKLLKEIIDKVSDGVYAADNNGTIIVYNTAFEIMEGTKKEEMLGRQDVDIYQMPMDYLQRLNILKTHKPILDSILSYSTYSGKKVNIVYNSYPFTENGQLKAVFAIGRDLNSTNKLMNEVTKHFNRKQTIRTNNGTRYHLDDIKGVSPGIKRAIDQAKRIAQIKTTATILGETGSGKELFAQGIHNSSSYSTEPFIAVNCAAIPETLMDSLMMGTVKGSFSGALDVPGFFEQAGKGTLFLDEINSLSLNLQPKLLRLLQDRTVRRIGDSKEREINCRVIFASNEDIFTSASNHKFREDLLYRMTPLILDIPPLRERMEDMPVLVEKFINDFNEEFGLNIQGLNTKLLESFMNYNWPGNVRELEHVIESSMSLAHPSDNLLTVDHLPTILRQRIKQSIIPAHVTNTPTDQKASLDNMLFEYEHKIIENCLLKNEGNVTATANELGIDRQSLHYRLRKLKLTPNNFRKSGS